ncbi:MAG: DUF6249 domain-containing protein [Pseudomonadota bacterium]|nr:DUF6249 domain-containing protein [Pseudomonadota bacterium]
MMDFMVIDGIDPEAQLTLWLVFANVAILFVMPLMIVWITSYYSGKDKNNRYQAVISVASNLKNPSEINSLLNCLNDKKTPTDYRRSGIITLGTGLGLVVLGMVLTKVIIGVGGLVSFIGVGQVLAGYLYPIESEEINKAVEDFESQ